jgi:hypothetical protein
MSDLDRQQLAQHWVHSHEEDQQGEQVFRPASYAFPPSRGRSALHLRNDGTYSESAPGPTDRPTESGVGDWEISGNELTLRAPDGSIQHRKVVTLQPDKLVLNS